MNWIEIVKQLPRYKDFTIVKEPIKFKDMFAGQNIDCVQLHSTEVVFDTIVGFCGVFMWHDNTLTPLDGDSYSENVLVLGYDWFEHNGEKCLDILVGNDW